MLFVRTSRVGYIHTEHKERLLWDVMLNVAVFNPFFVSFFFQLGKLVYAEPELVIYRSEK